MLDLCKTFDLSSAEECTHLSGEVEWFRLSHSAVLPFLLPENVVGRLKSFVDKHFHARFCRVLRRKSEPRMFRLGFELRESAKRTTSSENQQLYSAFDPFLTSKLACDSQLVQLDFCQHVESVHEDVLLTDDEIRFVKLKFGESQSIIRFVVRSLLPSATIERINDNFVNFSKTPINDFEVAHSRLLELGARNPKIHALISIINEQLDAHSSLDEVALSFNGGKDCTALLHALATIVRHRQRALSTPSQLKLILIDTVPLFEEQELYLQRATIFYECCLLRYRSNDMKKALCDVKADQPMLRSIFMGVRRSDLPESMASSATALQPTDTDRGWPEFLRINPLLDWSYADIWQFIGALQVPYCALYNYGYSSLGGVDNTVKNINLRLPLDDDILESLDERDPYCYLPASVLQLETTERNCRK